MDLADIFPQGGWSPQIHRTLVNLMKEEGRAQKIAVFDFDGTCIERDLGELALVTLGLSGWFRNELADFRGLFPESAEIPKRQFSFSRKIVSPSSFIHGQHNTNRLSNQLAPILRQYDRVMEELGPEAAYRWTAQVMVGLRPKRIEKLVAAIWEKEIHAPLEEFIFETPHGSLTLRTGIGIYEEVKNLIAVLHQLKWEVWIISATNEHVVKAVAPHFGVRTDRVIGLSLAINGWGRLTTRFESPMSVGTGKVDTLKRLKLWPDLVVGDSAGDYPMLMYGTMSGGRSLVIGDKIPRSLHHPNWMVQPRDDLRVVCS